MLPITAVPGGMVVQVSAFSMVQAAFAAAVMRPASAPGKRSTSLRRSPIDDRSYFGARLGLLLCGLGSEGGCDRVEVDEDRGPGGLEGRFSSPEVAALACSVAVDDESEQPLDSWPYAFEVLALGGVR